MAERVCLGVIIGAHGLQGLVRVKSFAEDEEAVACYGPLEDDQGEPIALTVIGRGRGALLARVDGVGDRDSAEALRGTRLHVLRETLPPVGKDEYYHADLIGLQVDHLNGAEIAFLKTHGGAGANPFPNNSDATFDAGSLRVVFGSASGRRRPARRAPACLEKRILTLLPKKAIRRAAAACRPRACSLAASPASGLQLRARSPGSGPEPGRWPPGPDLGLGKGRRASGA